MSDPTILVLSSLADGEKHGYAMMEDIQRFAGIRLGPGTLYGTLNRLVDDGLITETTGDVERDDNERRRYYRLTAQGEQVATAEFARLRTLVTRVGMLRPGLGGFAT